MKKIIFLVASLSLFFTQIHTQSDPLDVSSLIHEFEKKSVAYVDFIFTDIAGTLRSVTIPVTHAASALCNGLKFDGSSIEGYSAIFESDMHLKPDLNTCVILQEDAPVARIICDVYRTESQPFEGDPRWLLKHHLEHVHEMGYEFLVGPELEFFFLDKKTLEPVNADHYFQADGSMQQRFLNRELLTLLQKNRINVEKLHHEVAPGQYEISISYSNALEMADQIVLAKYLITLFAENHGMKATFMPKPLFGKNGSGMHVHFSLFDVMNNKNAFYNSNDTLYLSEFARQFIAGVLKHVPQLCAITNPTVNSYKRLVAGYEAPVYVCWATKNRSALIRIPQINEFQPRAARAELRSPDASCNPYLLFTALLGAGLSGIEHKEQLTDSIDENLFLLTPQEILDRGIATLPSSLECALHLLEKNMFAQKIFGEQLIKEFLTIKRKEVVLFNRSVTDWEIKHYL